MMKKKLGLLCLISLSLVSCAKAHDDNSYLSDSAVNQQINDNYKKYKTDQAELLAKQANNNQDKLTIDGGSTNSISSNTNKDISAGDIVGTKLISTPEITSKVLKDSNGKYKTQKSKLSGESLISNSGLTFKDLNGPGIIADKSSPSYLSTGDNIVTSPAIAADLAMDSKSARNAGKITVRNTKIGPSDDKELIIGGSTGTGTSTAGMLSRTGGVAVNIGTIDLDKNYKYGVGLIAQGGGSIVENDGEVNVGSTHAIGMEAQDVIKDGTKDVYAINNKTINLNSEGDIGMVAATSSSQKGKAFVTNNGDINLNGITNIGLLAFGPSSYAINNGNINIGLTSKGSFGMSAKLGGTIINNGNIYLANAYLKKPLFTVGESMKGFGPSSGSTAFLVDLKSSFINQGKIFFVSQEEKSLENVYGTPKGVKHVTFDDKLDLGIIKKPIVQQQQTTDLSTPIPTSSTDSVTSAAQAVASSSESDKLIKDYQARNQAPKVVITQGDQLTLGAGVQVKADSVIKGHQSTKGIDPSTYLGVYILKQGTLTIDKDAIFDDYETQGIEVNSSDYKDNPIGRPQVINNGIINVYEGFKSGVRSSNSKVVNNNEINVIGDGSNGIYLIGEKNALDTSSQVKSSEIINEVNGVINIKGKDANGLRVQDRSFDFKTKISATKVNALNKGTINVGTSGRGMWADGNSATATNSLTGKIVFNGDNGIGMLATNGGTIDNQGTIILNEDDKSKVIITGKIDDNDNDFHVTTNFIDSHKNAVFAIDKDSHVINHGKIVLKDRKTPIQQH